jgi:chaperonin GroES
MHMSFRPLSDLIIVEPKDRIDRIGVIELAPSAQEEATQGRVLAVGPGRERDGWREPMEIQVGDIVLFSIYAKEKFKFKGKNLITMRQADVIGIMND